MKARISIKEKDLGLRQLMDLAKQLREGGAHVKVGVLDDGRGGEDHGGLTTAQLAAIHEFGSADGHIPERSFIRSTFDANKNTYVQNLRKLLIAVVSGQISVDKMFNVMGAVISTDIKKRVTVGAQIPPPNAPSTIWKKTKGQREAVTSATFGAEVSARKNASIRNRAITHAQNQFSLASQAGPLRRKEAKALGGALAKANRMRNGASAAAISKLVRATSSLIDGIGKVRTLIDTGRMIGAVSWQFVRSN